VSGDRTAVVTDSAADLPAAWCEANGVEAVPLTVHVGGADHLDGVDLAADAFWARCRATTEPPTTASPSPEAFAAAFGRAAASGASAVVCVTLAAGLSSTFQSASLAARSAPLDVRVVDSRSDSLGQTTVVHAAVAAAGDGADAAVAAALDAAARVHVFGMLDGTDHLRRSGRLTTSQAFFGSVLSVKPLIALHDGRVDAMGRQRTVPRGLDALAALVVAARPQRLAVVHGDPTNVAGLLDRLRDVDPDPPVHLLGPVVGSHLGPGVVGVALIGTHPPA
jgi:DegV family protein with EDD domain